MLCGSGNAWIILYFGCWEIHNNMCLKVVIYKTNSSSFCASRQIWPLPLPGLGARSLSGEVWEAWLQLGSATCSTVAMGALALCLQGGQKINFCILICNIFWELKCLNYNPLFYCNSIYLKVYCALTHSWYWKLFLKFKRPTFPF